MFKKISNIFPKQSYKLQTFLTLFFGIFAISLSFSQESLSDDLVIYSAYSQEDFISPNGDNMADDTRISVYVSRACNVTLEIKNNSGETVRYFSEYVEEHIDFIWDGRNSQGEILPEGTYDYFVNARDPISGENADEVSDTIVIDITPPVAQVYEPQGGMLAGTADIKITANDENWKSDGVNTKVLIGNTTEPIDWITVWWNDPWWIHDAPFGPFELDEYDNPPVIFSWDTTWYPNGEHILKFEINDEAFNYTIIEVPVTVDNGLILRDVNADEDVISPNGDGYFESTGIYGHVNNECDVSLRIENSGGNVVRDFSEHFNEEVGAEFYWDGKDSEGNVAPDGEYAFYMQAHDPISGANSEEISGTIDIDTINPELVMYEPLSGEVSGTVDIKLTSNDEHWPTWGSNICVYLGEGTQPAQWDVVCCNGGMWWHDLPYGPFELDEFGNPPVLYSWDTSEYANGEYVLRVEVSDLVCNSITEYISITINNSLLIKKVSVTDRLFSPNGDGDTDDTMISGMVTEESDVTIAFKNESGENVRGFSLHTDEIFDSIWDGKNNEGNILPDGDYVYYINAHNPVTGVDAPEVNGNIEIDNTPPATVLYEPAQGSTISGMVDIKITSNDKNWIMGGDNTWIEIGEGTQPSEWDFVWCNDSFFWFENPPGPFEPDEHGEPPLLYTFDSSEYSNGDYVLKISINDRADNTAVLHIPVVIYNVAINDITDSIDPFSPNNDGRLDTTVITGMVTAESDVSINILNEDSDIVRTVAEHTAGAIEFIWDGKDDEGLILPDGQYIYIVSARDLASGVDATDVFGSVTIDNTPPDVSVSEPVNGSNLSETFDVKGIANDANWMQEEDSMYIEFGVGSEPDEWRRLWANWYDGPILPDIHGNHPVIFTWDTSICANGPGILRVTARDLAENHTVIEIPVSLFNVVLDNVHATYSFFSPNGDGLKDTTVITGSVTAESDVTIRIENIIGEVVRAYNLHTTDEIDFRWDGTDDEGSLLPDGEYTYYVNAYDASSGLQAKHASDLIVIDTVPPDLTISEPISGTYSGNIDIKGIADDQNWLIGDCNIWIEIGEGNNPSEWYWLWRGYKYSPYLPDGEGNHPTLYSWPTDNMDNGEYVLRIKVRDKADNYSFHEIPIYICHVSEFFVLNSLFSPNGDGVKDIALIGANFGRNANWNLSITNISEETIKYVNGAGDSIMDEWDGKDHQGAVVVDGEYYCRIEARDISTGEIIMDITESLEIDNTPPNAAITYPSSGDVLTERTYIKGIADDPHFDAGDSFLHYRRTDIAGDWIYLDQIRYPRPEEGQLRTWRSEDLPSGNYELRLIVADMVGNISEHIVPVEIYNVKVLFYDAKPDPFTPDGDGIDDVCIFEATLSMVLDWSIRVNDRDGVEICQFSGRGEEISQEWDGTNDLGEVVEDGKYKYYIKAEDPDSGQSTEVHWSLIADTAYPVAEITSITEQEPHNGIITIAGTASDNNIYNWKLEYASTSSPDFWTLLRSLNSTSMIETDLVEWNTYEITDDEYIVRLRVTDLAGHESIDEKTIIVNNIKISNVSCLPKFFDPVEGENCSLAYDIDKNADVTIKIYRCELEIGNPQSFSMRPISKTLSATPVLSMPHAPETHIFTWDGRDDLGGILPDGVYTYTIEAENMEGRTGWFDPEYVQDIVTIQNTSVSDSFNPFMNNYCEVTYDLVEPAWVNLSISRAGWIMRYLVNFNARPKYDNVELWDGRDSNGDIVAGGSFAIRAFTQKLPENSVVIRKTDLEITSLKANAYLIRPMYSEVSTISYSISKDSYVTIKIYDPNGNYFCTLQEDTELRPDGPYDIEWHGRNDNDDYVYMEGDYRVEVAIRDDEDNTSVRNGAIVVYK